MVNPLSSPGSLSSAPWARACWWQQLLSPSFSPQGLDTCSLPAVGMAKPRELRGFPLLLSPALGSPAPGQR